MVACRTSESAARIPSHRSSTRRPISVLGILLLCLFLARPAALGQGNDICIMCHGDAAMFAGMPNAEDLVVRPERIDASVHGSLGMQCVDCHMDLAGFERIWLLTDQLPRTRTHVIGTRMVQTMFTEFKVGQATAIAVLMFLMVFVGGASLLRTMRRERLEF